MSVSHMTFTLVDVKVCNAATQNILIPLSLQRIVNVDVLSFALSILHVTTKLFESI